LLRKNLFATTCPDSSGKALGTKEKLRFLGYFLKIMFAEKTGRRFFKGKAGSKMLRILKTLLNKEP
jgi:hypothetical protein